jgi:hypothetical protein
MYTVIWSDSALDRLAELYVAASPGERNRMALGIDAFNRLLSEQPLEVGESRSGLMRIGFPDLLAVRFRVDSDARIVRVVGVIRFGR